MDEDEEWKDDHYYHQFFDCEQNDNNQEDQEEVYPDWQNQHQEINDNLYYQSQEDRQENQQNSYKSENKIIKKQSNQTQNQKFDSISNKAKKQTIQQISQKENNNKDNKNNSKKFKKLESINKKKRGFSTKRKQFSQHSTKTYEKITTQIGLKAIILLHNKFPHRQIEKLIQGIKERIESKKQKQDSQLITMTMDQLQTYHLKSGVKKFIPPPSYYTYSSLRVKQEQKNEHELLKAEYIKLQNKQNEDQNQMDPQKKLNSLSIQKYLSEQQQFVKIKQTFCLTKLVRQSKSYSDLKNIIFKRFNNRDAYKMSKDKDQYLKNLATMKQAAIYFFKIGYSVKKLRHLMDHYSLSRIRYQKIFFTIIRLIVRLVQTFIVKHYLPNLPAIPHSPELLLLQAPFHHPFEHFQPRGIQIYYKILRLMFQIEEDKQNKMKFQDILYFYQEIKGMIKRALKQRQKYRQEINGGLISKLRGKHKERD